MADKSDATGILKGIQNVLVLRRQNRMDEAKQELQGVKFKMLQREMDMRDEEHKASQAFRKWQMERDKYTMSASDVLKHQEAGFKSRAMNILHDPNSTPEQKRQAEGILGIPQQRAPADFTLGTTRFEGGTGREIASVEPPPPADFTLGTTRFRGTGEEIASVQPPPPRLSGAAAAFEYRESLPQEKRLEFDAWYEKSYGRGTESKIVRDFNLLMEGIPEGTTPELRKLLEQRNQAILDQYIDKKKISAFKEKLNEKKEFGPISEEDVNILTGIYGKKRQPTPKLMGVSETIDILTNLAIMMTGKSKDNGNEAIRELRKNPEKYLGEWTKQVHSIGGGTAREGRPTFYGYASQMIGQTINPEGAVEVPSESPTAPEQLAPPQSWQEVLDRGQHFVSDAEYFALLESLGPIPDELLDALEPFLPEK
jgi:hypothetical protein